MQRNLSPELSVVLGSFIDNNQSTYCFSFFGKKDTEYRFAKICYGLLHDNNQKMAKALIVAIAVSTCTQLKASVIKAFGYKDEADCLHHIINEYPLAQKERVSDMARNFGVEVLK